MQPRTRTFVDVRPSQVNLLLSDLKTHGATVTKNDAVESGTITQDGDCIEWEYIRGTKHTCLFLTVVSNPLDVYRAAEILDNIDRSNSVHQLAAVKE